MQMLPYTLARCENVLIMFSGVPLIHDKLRMKMIEKMEAKHNTEKQEMQQNKTQNELIAEHQYTR